MMMTPQDEKMFQALSASETGKQLQDYLDRVLTWMHDIRTLGSHDDTAVKGRLEAVMVVEKLVWTRLKDAGRVPSSSKILSQSYK